MEAREEVMIYKDFHMTKPWSEKTFVVEFKDDKARVHDNSGFPIQTWSRFNKLHRQGGVIQGKKYLKSFYTLTVNGYRVYFKAEYSISK